ncbi:MAG TPA: NAD-dependent epimerase/dehydratase family protein [Trebonia sp.]
MRLLVLGGTRFIGDRIVREALRRGDEVIVVHRGVTEPADAPNGGNLTHLHAARMDFSAISDQVQALRPDAVVDTNAMTRANADAVLPHLPSVPLVLLSSMDVYRAYELLLADQTGKERGKYGQPVPLTEESEVRHGRYPLGGIIDGRDDYEKLDVEPGYLDRGGTVLRLAAIYGERDPQRREEFILRRVRAGRTRIPVGAGTWLWTRGYVGDVASAVLAVLDSPAATSGEIFNVGDLATDTVRDYANRILAAAGHDAELVTVPDSVLPADLEITKTTPQHFLGDCGKLTRSVDWRPGDAGDGIIRSVKWHLNNPPEAAPDDFAADEQALAAIGQVG